MLRPRWGGARRLLAAACAALAALALPHQAFAQSRTATANAQAVIVTPGSIVKTADMDFGSVGVAATGGTVVMTAASTPTCTASAGLIHSGACQSAAFTIRGIRNQHVRIRDSGNSGVVTLTGPGGATMTMDTMTIGQTGMTATGGGGGWDFGNYQITDPSGNANFWIGGTLHVAATQAPGVYNGTLNIQIQFN